MGRLWLNGELIRTNVADVLGVGELYGKLNYEF